MSELAANAEHGWEPEGPRALLVGEVLTESLACWMLVRPERRLELTGLIHDFANYCFASRTQGVSQEAAASRVETSLRSLLDGGFDHIEHSLGVTPDPAHGEARKFIGAVGAEVRSALSGEVSRLAVSKTLQRTTLDLLKERQYSPQTERLATDLVATTNSRVPLRSMRLAVLRHHISGDAWAPPYSIAGQELRWVLGKLAKDLVGGQPEAVEGAGLLWPLLGIGGRPVSVRELMATSEDPDETAIRAHEVLEALASGLSRAGGAGKPKEPLDPNRLSLDDALLGIMVFAAGRDTEARAMLCYINGEMFDGRKLNAALAIMRRHFVNFYKAQPQVVPQGYAVAWDLTRRIFGIEYPGRAPTIDQAIADMGRQTTEPLEALASMSSDVFRWLLRQWVLRGGSQSDIFEELATWKQRLVDAQPNRGDL